MPDIVYDEDGSIDWNANGWPNPNPLVDPEFEGYDVESMPDDIFELWQSECEEMETDWSADW